MTYADKLASRVKNVLKRQVQNKGYEVKALLSKKIGDANELGINDTGEADRYEFSEVIDIIVTSHDITLFPMELGDNPDDLLDFIWIEDANTPVFKKVNEGMLLEYSGNIYEVKTASPTSLGGNLVIKECRAVKRR